MIRWSRCRTVILVGCFLLGVFATGPMVESAEPTSRPLDDRVQDQVALCLQLGGTPIVFTRGSTVPTTVVYCTGPLGYPFVCINTASTIDCTFYRTVGVNPNGPQVAGVERETPVPTPRPTKPARTPKGGEIKPTAAITASATATMEPTATATGPMSDGTATATPTATPTSAATVPPTGGAQDEAGPPAQEVERGGQNATSTATPANP